MNVILMVMWIMVVQGFIIAIVVLSSKKYTTHLKSMIIAGIIGIGFAFFLEIYTIFGILFSILCLIGGIIGLSYINKKERAETEAIRRGLNDAQSEASTGNIKRAIAIYKDTLFIEVKQIINRMFNYNTLFFKLDSFDGLMLLYENTGVHKDIMERAKQQLVGYIYQINLISGIRRLQKLKDILNGLDDKNRCTHMKAYYLGREINEFIFNRINFTMNDSNKKNLPIA